MTATKAAAPIGTKRKAPEKRNDTYAPLRLSAELLERVKKMQEVEIRRLMYPVARAEVLRKCITLGLLEWESQQKPEVLRHG